MNLRIEIFTFKLVYAENFIIGLDIQGWESVRRFENCVFPIPLDRNFSANIFEIHNPAFL
jgi:hypothetical protein